jgi:hypothetical protein
VLLSPLSCRPSVYEACEPATCGKSACSCGVSADCARIAYCVPKTLAPPSRECSPEGLSCAIRGNWIDEISGWIGVFEADTADALRACQSKLTGPDDCGFAEGGASAGGASAGGEAGNRGAGAGGVGAGGAGGEAGP